MLGLELPRSDQGNGRETFPTAFYLGNIDVRFVSFFKIVEQRSIACRQVRELAALSRIIQGFLVRDIIVKVGNHLPPQRCAHRVYLGVR